MLSRSLRGLPHARRHYSNVTQNSPIDVGYMLSLLERPKRSPHAGASLSPERWPDISVETELVTSRSPSSAHPCEASDLLQLGDTPTATFDTAMTEEKQLCASENFDDVLDRELPETCRSLKHSEMQRMEGIINAANTYPQLSCHEPRRSGTMKGAFQLYLKDIKFGNLESKSICSILAKAFGYDLEAGLQPAAAPQETADVAAAAARQTAQTSSRAVPERVLILSGADLHLLEYGKLQRLARLYGLSANDSRRSLERALVNFFVSVQQRAELILLRVLEEPHSSKEPIDVPLKVFTRARKKLSEASAAACAADVKAASDAASWTEQQDRALLQVVQKVHDARQQVLREVDSYLQTHCPDQETAPQFEDGPFWEVVAQHFPASSTTAKALKRRWQVLQRMQFMVSDT